MHSSQILARLPVSGKWEGCGMATGLEALEWQGMGALGSTLLSPFISYGVGYKLWTWKPRIQNKDAF